MISILYTSNHLVVIIGLGLIGSQIKIALKKRINFEEQTLVVNWSDAQYFMQLFPIELNKVNPGNFKKIDVVWAAGKVGFSASFEDCKPETNHLLKCVTSLQSITKDSQFFFHYLSSAGALFDGQIGVDAMSMPSPERPYGQVKLEQEGIVKSAFSNVYIYRPSTVYGPYLTNKRVGLIAVLIQNLFANKTSFIYGNMNTLRDYIWVGDVAHTIAENIIKNSEESIQFLVSGKPSSIFEICTLINKMTNRKPLVQYVAAKEAKSMTFSPKLTNGHVTDLETGIGKVLNHFN